MEDIVAVATRAMVKGSVETVTELQADSLGEHAARPTFGKSCELERENP